MAEKQKKASFRETLSKVVPPFKAWLTVGIASAAVLVLLIALISMAA